MAGRRQLGVELDVSDTRSRHRLGVAARRVRPSSVRDSSDSAAAEDTRALPRQRELGRGFFPHDVTAKASFEAAKASSVMLSATRNASPAPQARAIRPPRGMPAGVKAQLPDIFAWCDRQPDSDFETTLRERNCVGEKYTLVDAMFRDPEKKFVVQYIPFSTCLSTPRNFGDVGISAQRVGARRQGDGHTLSFKLTSYQGNTVQGWPQYTSRVATNANARVYFVVRTGARGCVALRIRTDVWDEPVPVMPLPCNWRPSNDPAEAGVRQTCLRHPRPCPTAGADADDAVADAADAAALMPPPGAAAPR